MSSFTFNSKIMLLIYASALSIVVWSVSFAFFIHKPLTIGIIGDYLEHKTNYLRSVTGKKVIVLAGSNGRFSHSCAVIEREISVPCINMSISASVSLDFMIAQIKPYLKTGDIIYLPIEYGNLSGTEDSLNSNVDLPYMMSYDLSSLQNVSFKRAMSAVFYFDIKYIFSALTEMALNSSGFKRRYSVSTLTINGDESGHSPANSIPYAGYIQSVKPTIPTLTDEDMRSYKSLMIRDFLVWAHSRGVIVIGGLPSIFSDINIPEQTLKSLERFYTSNNAFFERLDNNSQYARSCFYDTQDHLNEACQIVHSKLVSQLFRKYLKEDRL